MGWQDFASEIFHYRDKDQDEIDFIIERPTGDLIAIEVKASATVSSADFRGLRKLAAATGDAFKLGIVAYDSDRIVPFGRRLFAAPVACLWST
jgi:predicted AAA+ superfamily ATPase